MNACAIMYESDTDFGQLSTIPSTLSQPKSVLLLIPSQKIDPESISHLTPKQQTELLEVLDRYPECFSDIPGHVDVVEHAVTLADGFGPRRLSACRVPERLGPEVIDGSGRCWRLVSLDLLKVQWLCVCLMVRMVVMMFI